MSSKQTLALAIYFILRRYSCGPSARVHSRLAGQHDPWPWLRYFVGLVARSYEDFAMVTFSARSGGSEQDRVRDYVEPAQRLRTGSFGLRGATWTKHV